MALNEVGEPVTPPLQPARPAVGAVRLAGLCLRAMLHLIRARLQHRRFRTDDVARRNRLAAAAVHLSGEGRPEDREIIPMIAWVLPRVANRMPFRSDCLVQAMAAQDWLRDHGIPSSIAIGVLSRDDRPFESHAWLDSGDTVVVGGAVEDFRQILG